MSDGIINIQFLRLQEDLKIGRDQLGGSQPGLGSESLLSELETCNE